MEPTSEQELKQLLEEGRITEEEHRELLEAIRQKETMKKPVEKQNEPKPRTGKQLGTVNLLSGVFMSPSNTHRSVTALAMSEARAVAATGSPQRFTRNERLTAQPTAILNIADFHS